MIRFFSDVGLSLPLTAFFSLSPAYIDRGPLDKLDLYAPWNNHTIELALQSHCPPLLLEVLLKDYARRGYSLTSIIDDNDELIPSCRINLRTARVDMFSYRETCISRVVKSLYSDLMNSTGWQEEYPGEVADIWEKKIGLFNRFRALSEPEKDLLLAILRSLRAIGRMPPASCHNDKAARWSILCESVKPFLMTPALQAHDRYRPTGDPAMTRRSHRFVIQSRDHWESWNPWREWYINRLYEQKWHEWCLEKNCDLGAFRKYMSTGESYSDRLSHRARSRSLPLWYEVD
jgi:hypothetical protein